MDSTNAFECSGLVTNSGLIKLAMLLIPNVFKNWIWADAKALAIQRSQVI